MTSTAIRAQGTTLALSNGASPVVYTTIANVTGISGPNTEAPDIDVSDLSSTKREYRQGLADDGEVVVSGYYKQANAQHAQLRDDVGDDTNRTFRLTFSDSDTADFVAKAKAFNLDMQVDGAVEMTITLKIDGAVTWSA